MRVAREELPHRAPVGGAVGGHPDARRRGGWALVLGLKATLVALLLFALAHPDWERFTDKAMGARAATYPLAMLVVPVAVLVARRRGRVAGYPLAVDGLLVAPFVVDVAGNALDLYDRVPWFDDACHFGNWALISGALGAWLVRRGTPALSAAAHVVGFGATTAILWELAEYGAFLLDTPEVLTIYRDTIGDLTLGLSGSAMAAGLTALAVRRRR